MKLNGGDNKLLKDRLFKSFNDNKNYYLDIFIRKSNINELLKLSSVLNIAPKTIIKKAMKNYTGEDITITNLTKSINDILKYLKNDDNNQILFDSFYNIYKLNIEELYSKYKKNRIINDTDLNFINKEYKFDSIYDVIINIISEANKKEEISISRSIFNMIKNNIDIKKFFLNIFTNIDFKNIKNHIKYVFDEIIEEDINNPPQINENEENENEEDENEEDENQEGIKKGTKKINFSQSQNPLDFIIKNTKNTKGPLLSTTSLYDKAYSSKSKPNKLNIDLKRLKEEFEISKKNIDIIKKQIDELNDLDVKAETNNINYNKLKEERSKNNFNKVRDVTKMTGTTINNLAINVGRSSAFLISTITNYLKIIVHGGEGILLKLLVLVFIIILIISGYAYFKTNKDANLMSFMNNIDNKFFVFNDYKSFYNRMLEYLKGILPLSLFNGLNIFSNNISYLTTGQNIYDNYLLPRDEIKEGRSDNIFHINYKNTYGTVIDKNKTYCTIRPKDIIINYNENNYPNSDFNKLDADLKNDIDFYNYYYIPITDNKTTGKYELDLSRSTFNNNPSMNSNLQINNSLSKYKLFKYNNNNLILNNFNNVYYDTKFHINNNPINTIESYSAYGIYLVNPNYLGINIAMVDINFNKQYFKNTALNNLNTYISIDEIKNNIYYIKINKKNPTFIYVSNNEYDENNQISIFDFINTNNNISILKLYNQIEEFEMYDLKFNIPIYNNDVIPPKLKYDNQNKRFYIDFILDGDNSCYLSMDKAINGSINPIYEISVNANDLNIENNENCDNYFLLFPSLYNNNLFTNNDNVRNDELENIILNFQNTQGREINYKYSFNIWSNPKKHTISRINNGAESYKYDFDANYFNIIKYYSNDDKRIYNNLATKIKFENVQSNSNEIHSKLYISYIFLLYFILNYYSRCIFFINLYGSNRESTRLFYYIYLLSNNENGGNINIFSPKNGLGGLENNQWDSNKIFKIDMTKYINLRTNNIFYKNKSIQSIGSSSINFKNNTQIYNYFNENKEYIHNNLMNSDRKLEKNLYFKEPKNFIGKLYSLVINKY